MTWFGTYLLNELTAIAVGGTPLTTRQTLNFVNGATITDIAATNSTNLAILQQPFGPANLAVSIVDIAMGGGQAAGPIKHGNGPQTSGVCFTATQAGHYCTGARFFWGAEARSIAITLWSKAGGNLATVDTTTASSAGVYTASFASPVALTPGTQYAITFADLTTNPPGGSHYWYYAGGVVSGLTNMSPFMPASSTNSASQWGPWILGVAGIDFTGGSPNMSDIYGLYSSTSSYSTPNTIPDSSSVDWYAIEPIVS